MEITSEIQLVTPSILSRLNSDATSISSSLQTRNKINNIINPSNKENSKLIKEMLRKRSNNPPTNKSLKDIDENEVYQEVMYKIFQHEVDSIEALIMHRELNNIKGLNKESSLFKDKTRNNTEKLK